ncbi:MAG: murein biosynthesis integral membrane protein MurJ [Candidatus Aureabacteria bacterium]|nr:murein biosynthesis integral membrane protein MurJ [Candidatus Auribacterota bacterium]
MDKQEKDNKRIFRSAFIVGLMNFLSRVLGLIRSILMASFLGTTFIADAFTVGFKIPNLLRRLLGEGSLTPAFIPVFSEIQKEANHDKAVESLFLNRFLSLLYVLLMFLCVLGVILSPLLVIFLYAFGKQSPEMAILLTRIMFCYLGFICLAVVAQGVLNANFKFAVPAATSVVLNAVIIISPFLLKDLIPESWILACLPCTSNLLKQNPELLQATKAAIAFSIGVLLGGAIQFFMQVPPMRRLGYRFAFTFDFKDRRIKQIGKLMLPGVFGLGIYQINTLVSDPFVLALLEEGSLAALNYSNRLIEFALGIFVISITTVILPSLSRYVTENNMNAYADLIRSSVRSVIFITIPSSIGLILLREPIVAVFFKSKLFQDESVRLVSTALFYHTLGILPIGLYRIYAPAFYAQKDTKTPVVSAVYSLIVNIILCMTLPRWMGIGGIALASTLASATSAVYLMNRLRRQFSGIDVIFEFRMALSSLAAASVMGFFLVWFRIHYLSGDFGRLHLSFFLGLAILCGVGLYYFMALALKIREAEEIRKKIMTRFL